MSDRPLTIGIEDDELVIRIGFDSLKFATENNSSDYFTTEEGGNLFVVTDPKTWAESVVSMLKVEEEDGTTPVHEMFDAAFIRAIEYGEKGIDIVEQGSIDE